MSEAPSNEISPLEQEFRDELRGDGSFSPYIADGTVKGEYVGFDIHPEDISALFFDGIGVPRWESIKAGSVEEQEKIYMDQFNAIMAKYPMLGRANDTEQKANFSAAEVPALIAECEQISSSASEAKALRAAQKFLIAAGKASNRGVALSLLPRLDYT